MKIFAYMTVSLCLPFVLLAEGDETGEVEPSPDKAAEQIFQLRLRSVQDDTPGSVS